MQHVSYNEEKIKQLLTDLIVCWTLKENIQQ